MSRHPLTAPALAACALLAVAAAQAQNAPAAAPPAAAAPAVAAAPPDSAPVARATRAGPYMIVAVGRSDYDYDCFLFTDCKNARGTSGKLGGGYRFGTFAIEGWWTDYGKADTTDANGSVRLRGLGVSASWLMRFGDVAEGLLRAGLADTRYTRSFNGVSVSGTEFQPTFGLGLGFLVSPQVSIELAWDVTRGDAPDTDTVLTNALSVGLRLRF